LVLLLLLAILTALAVLVSLSASFASHCYFLRVRHRVFWFRIASITKGRFNFLTEDGSRIIRNVSKHTVGAGADKILGVQRIFAQISPNLPEQNDLQKN